MLYDANDKPVESTLESNDPNEGYGHIPSQNFPPPTPKPDWFDAAVNKIGGFIDPGTNKIPRYRVVWGMSEKHFAMGQMRLKYPTILDTIETTIGYNVIDSKRGRRQYLPAKKALEKFQDPVTKQMTRGIEPGVLIVPVVKLDHSEIGTPLWVAEYFMEPEGFGTEEAWERDRYLVHNEDATKYIDAIGPYPKKGAYLEWFQLFDIDEEGRASYRPLDEGAIELIRANHVLNIARRKNMVYDTIEKRRERQDAHFESEWDKFDREFTTDILDVKKNRHFDTPGIKYPGKG